MFLALAKAGDSTTRNQTSRGLSQPRGLSRAPRKMQAAQEGIGPPPRIRARKLAYTIPSLREATISLRGGPRPPPQSVLKGLKAAA